MSKIAAFGYGIVALVLVVAWIWCIGYLGEGTHIACDVVFGVLIGTSLAGCCYELSEYSNY